MTQNPLLILKASAGSGKTYALVQEYLRVILHADSIDAFSRIMAMTFTNKAALEMKERVVNALVDLAFGGEEKEKFLRDTAERIQLSKEEVRTKSRQVIKRILHNYSELSIQTIDKFNIRLVRTFTRDLDLPGDFELILDARELIEKTIDTLIDSIGEKGKEELSRMLLDYARKNSEEEASWDFRDALINFTRLTEKEENLQVIEKINQMTFNRDLFEQLAQDLAQLEQKFDTRKNELGDYIQARNWTKSDFKYNTGVLGRIELLPQSTLTDVGPLTEHMTQKLKEVISDGHATLTPDFAQKCLDFYAWVEEVKDKSNALTNAQKSFYQLALLRYIGLIIKDIRSRDSLLQLSEVNSLIAGLIQSESAPFIYERIGNRYDNYLLDEFQDTSRLQWLNLIPLLHESMSHGNSNLIVGDAKQAIYRFRNGLVEQFAALPAIYNPEGYAELERKSTFFQQMSRTSNLKENWRSKQEIVNFNNALFTEFAKKLPEGYQSYYQKESLEQIPKGSTGGFIYAEIQEAATDLELVDDHDLVFLDQVISETINDGYSPGDICILARTSDDCSRWANYLIHSGYFVMSDEGMKVKQSPKVRLLLAYIKMRHKPFNKEYSTLFAESYCTLFTENSFATLHHYHVEGKFDFDAFVQATFGDRSALFMRYENLYDLAQLFMRLVDLDELSDPYLHYFCNMLVNFDLQKGPNLGDFVKYFEDKGYNENVPLPERDDAITVMTAHKSKGLEFPVVILPNLKWKYGVRQNEKLIIEDNYHDVIYIASPSKNGTKRQQEENQRMIDANLLDETNLFYVACTRAVDRLYLNASGKNEANFLDKHIRDVLKQLPVWTEINETSHYSGSRTFTPHTRSPRTIFQPEPDRKRLWFPDISLIDQDTLDEVKISKEARFGKLIHLAMEKMIHADSMQEVIVQLSGEQELHPEEIKELTDTLTRVIEHPEIHALIFPTGQESLLNEREIVVSPSERIRPDRVVVDGTQARVIDFKTGIPRTKDEKQIRNYTHALKEIGFANCTAWLIYTDTLQIKQVG
jgi:ATP-dependent exoDNAse (exonuclease V) beta subunit